MPRQNSRLVIKYTLRASHLRRVERVVEIKGCTIFQPTKRATEDIELPKGTLARFMFLLSNLYLNTIH